MELAQNARLPTSLMVCVPSLHACSAGKTAHYCLVGQGKHTGSDLLDALDARDTRKLLNLLDPSGGVWPGGANALVRLVKLVLACTTERRTERPESKCVREEMGLILAILESADKQMGLKRGKPASWQQAQHTQKQQKSQQQQQMQMQQNGAAVAGPAAVALPGRRRGFQQLQVKGQNMRASRVN